MENDQRSTYSHLQFTQANPQSKNCKRVCLLRLEKRKNTTYNNRYKNMPFWTPFIAGPIKRMKSSRYIANLQKYPELREKVIQETKDQ
jgi:hypothetical protein